MKTQLLLCFFFACTLTSLQAQWEQTKGPEGGNVSHLLRDKDRLWAATGSGLWYSTDEAATWHQHPGIPTNYTVFALHRHTNNALYLLARTYDPVVLDYVYPVFKSTDDGQTWAVISEVPFWYPGTIRFHSIKGKLFVREDNDFFESPDQGLNWQEIVRPADYAGITNDSATMIAQDYEKGVFISTDASASWQQIADSSAHFSSFYFVKGNLILGEKWLGSGTGYAEVISQDLGQTWNDFSGPPNPMNYGLQFFDGGGDTILGISDIIYYSTDLGASWQQWGNPSEQFILPAILTGFGALGYNAAGVWKYSYDTGEWQRANTGLRTSSIYALRCNNNYLFARTADGLFRSPDDGEHWQQIDIPFYLYDTNFEVGGDSLYLTGYGTVMFCTANGSSDWDTLATTGTYSPDHISIQGGKIVWEEDNALMIIDRQTGTTESLEFPPGSTFHFNHFLRIIGNRYVYSDNDGSVYVSDDQGNTWTQTLDQWLPGNNVGNRLEYFLSRLFLCTRNGIYISADNGTSWSGPFTSGLPSSQFGDVPDITSMTVSGNFLILATGSRTYLSTNLGADWQLFNEGFNDARPFVLDSRGDQLFAGTRNDGVWRRFVDLELLGGTVYHDDNDNGARDAGEAPFPGRLLETQPSGFLSVSQSDGAYSMFADLTNDTLRIVPFSPYVTVNPAFRLASQAASGLDFGVHLTSGIKDLEVTLTNVQPFNPGFPTSLVITCRNKGTVALNPVVVLSLDSAFYYSSATPLPDSLIGLFEMAWHLPTLEPFQSADIQVWGATLVPAVPGDIIQARASIYPVDQDMQPSDNIAELREIVVASYDPNDKQVSPENISPAQIADGERLTYTIRFQNTGTFPATFVRIVDTLDQNFDIATLQVLSASHPFTWSLRGQNVLEFFFDQVNLPDSSSNEPASHGFVKYSVRPKADVTLGTSLPNRAFIYFDFNVPVETNTTGTVVAWSLHIYQPESNNPLVISPNPGSQWVDIQRNEPESVWMTVSDAMGKIILNQNVAEKNIRLDIHDWPSGMYRVLILGKSGKQGGIIIVQR
ncbi:MAG: T9SS type A sorting domain-containing protein [Saprospiraceae bacterium]|nr:T9SS type A sorting domain-containing protein [Saprospiraceae bacterium]